MERRIWEHKTKFKTKSFSAKYNLDQLLYYENYYSIEDSIAREKQLKNWHRPWKLNLIRQKNHLFLDLAADWDLSFL